MNAKFVFERRGRLIGHKFLEWLSFLPFWEPIRGQICNRPCVHLDDFFPFCTSICIAWSNEGSYCLDFWKCISTILICPLSQKACVHCTLLVPCQQQMIVSCFQDHQDRSLQTGPWPQRQKQKFQKVSYRKILILRLWLRVYKGIKVFVLCLNNKVYIYK